MFNFASFSIKTEIVKLFSSIVKQKETDSRYKTDVNPVARCRKGLEYNEFETGTKLTIRYWTMSYFQLIALWNIISKITDLEELQIIGCSLDDEELKKLVRCLLDKSKLTKLNLSENRLKNISPLKELQHLPIIDLDLSLNGNIENVEVLTFFKSLQILSLKVNLIKNVSSIGEITTLKRLNLSLNQIEDISPLWKLQNLTFLDLSANMYIQYIGQLSSLKNLKILNICACDIKSLDYVLRLKHNLPNCEIFHNL